MVSAVCGVQLKDEKRAKNLILMFGLNERMDHLSMEVFVGMTLCYGWRMVMS